MKKEIFKNMEIPEGVEVNIDKNIVFVKGKEGEIKKKFDLSKLVLEKTENKIKIGSKKATKKEKRMINTIFNHIKNMIKGVQKKFEYQLKICFNHFPMTVEIKEKDVTIKNFLGEKVPRKTKIAEGAEVKLDKEIITVSSVDKEAAGQTAANFEMATKVGARDRRIFQDGIFMINKAGKDI
ncbi:MAG: 50S ribosomal protein L6 [Nanoarchaeota archaeon]|nr:50S ribosomal protein L6 [Nanoarchaeota archaeon]